MFIQIIIIVAILLIANGVLVWSRICMKTETEEQLSRLKSEKIAKGVKKDEIDEEDLRDEIEPNQKYTWIFGVIICLDVWIVGAVITHIWAAAFFEDVQQTDSRKALFGDSFGAVNALISALAFAGMIVAFVLQRYELRLQRKELKENRTEMTQQTSQFAAENRNLEIQRFENLFYNMLNLQQKIVDGLRYDYYDNVYVTVPLDGGGTTTDVRREKREVVGREVFRYLFVFVPLEEKWDHEIRTIYGFKQHLISFGLGDYDGTLITSYLDHYFTHLYRIVQFVDSQCFSFEEKYRYLSYLRATLSRYELVWLYYNSLNRAFNNFKLLIEKYSLLKALRPDLLSISKEALSFYDGLGLTQKDFEDNNIGLDDFAFYLTDNPNEQSKYMISAFWNNNDMEKGIQFLEQWRAFIDERSNRAVEATSDVSTN